MPGTLITFEGSPANKVANFFVAFANEHGDVLTNLKLQKLVYYAQAWYLANFGSHLFDDDFEAWIHGPVLPTMYSFYKNMGIRGANPIVSDLTLPEVRELMPEGMYKFLESVAQVYMKYAAYELELMTHKETPWLQARGDDLPDTPSTTIISKESMRTYYKSKIV